MYTLHSYYHCTYFVYKHFPPCRRLSANTNQMFGEINAPLIRMFSETSYTDGLDMPPTGPNPRVLSNLLGDISRTGFVPSRVNASIYFIIFGQFIDHDLTSVSTQSGDAAETMNIIYFLGKNPLYVRILILVGFKKRRNSLFFINYMLF